MPDSLLSSVRRAALALVSTQGIKGLSLRALAQQMGLSLGSLSYRVGDKSALTALILNQEEKERVAWRAQWIERTALLDLTEPRILAAVLCAYLDEAAYNQREASILFCELLLDAMRVPENYSGLLDLIGEEERFWTQMLGPRHPAADLLDPAIAAYCRDELPFTLAANGDPDYRLLRMATISRVTEGLAGRGADLAPHFGTLTAAMARGGPLQDAAADLPEGSRKAELAEHVAALILESGVASVTHRLVAAHAGVSNSSIAHHFRTSRELVEAGLNALILRARNALRSEPLDDVHGLAMVRATHSIALAATRDPMLVPAAIDMRRRRAENVRARMADRLGGVEAIDPAGIQAALMILAGFGYPLHIRDGAQASRLGVEEQLIALRTTCTAIGLGATRSETGRS